MKTKKRPSVHSVDLAVVVLVLVLCVAFLFKGTITDLLVKNTETRLYQYSFMIEQVPGQPFPAKPFSPQDLLTDSQGQGLGSVVESRLFASQDGVSSAQLVTTVTGYGHPGNDGVSLSPNVTVKTGAVLQICVNGRPYSVVILSLQEI